MKNSSFIYGIVILITLAISLNACKKDTTVTNTNCTTYLPLKQANTWVYGSPDGYFTLTLGADTVINNITYTKASFIDSTGNYYPDTYYFRNSNGNIWGLFPNGSQAFTFGNGGAGEILLVKDSAYVGETWSSSGNKTRTVIEAGTSLVIANQTINNVIRIRETDITTNFNQDYYFAKCLGLIKSTGGNGSAFDTLQTYTLH